VINTVVATATKAKIDVVLAVVYMLIPKYRYSLYKVGLT
jgi:hypothetical protein